MLPSVGLVQLNRFAHQRIAAFFNPAHNLVQLLQVILDGDRRGCAAEADVGDFLYAIDHYKFTGTGVVLDGIIYRGTVNVGDELQITGMDFDTQLVTISNIKVDDTEVTSAKAKAGHPVTLIIDKVSSNYIFYGQVVIKPDSIKIHKKFNADIKLLSSSNGGRHTSITSSYYTNIVFRSEDHDPPGTIYLPEGKDSLNPGESSSVTIELKVNSAMEIGDCFVIREGEKEIGSGTVTEFLD